MTWTEGGEATSPVHQGCPVPFYDFDIVAWAGGRVTVTRINFKAGELQPQHFLIRDLYRLCPLKVGRIIFGVVWRGDNTCGKAVFQVELKKGNIFDIFL